MLSNLTLPAAPACKRRRPTLHNDPLNIRIVVEINITIPSGRALVLRTEPRPSRASIPIAGAIGVVMGVLRPLIDLPEGARRHIPCARCRDSGSASPGRLHAHSPVPGPSARRQQSGGGAPAGSACPRTSSCAAKVSSGSVLPTPSRRSPPSSTRIPISVPRSAPHLRS